ncbi:MAG: glycosyltransferase, partial [Anaerolineae bacterium]|nr:glycosyltransferase [Anaerolineae bacterium]
GSREIFGHIQSPHITVTGQLPSVLPYLTHADVALVPLMFESGTRFKIMEAGICGVPLVSTTLGAEGLPVRHGRELLIADEADAFAAAIIQLVQNKPLAQRLAANCRQLIAKFCSIDWLVQEAATIVQFLMAEQPAVQPPPHIEAWLELGKRHYHLGQYEQALLQFQQVVELEPKNAKVWSAVAQIAKQLNDQRTYEAASTLVRQATTFDHQAAATWLAEVAKSNVISSPYSAPLQAPRAAAPPALRPWTPAYFDRRDKFVAEASRHRQFQLMFQQGTPLPNGYGVGLDERCIEYPWFFAVADPAARQYLDAGSALNQEFAVRHPFWSGQRLTLAPLAPADVLVDLPWLASWPGDLRQTDFSTGFFDEIVCLSTLDQVGQAASSFSRDAAKYDNLIETLKELRRVLTPGGRLLLTVPFGKYQHWGEFQQFDSLLLERAANAFGAIRRQERFYRYTSQGWQLARAAAECANLEYAASAVKMQWGAKETAALPEPDGAAAARAVACCIWQRD